MSSRPNQYPLPIGPPIQLERARCILSFEDLASWEKAYSRDLPPSFPAINRCSINTILKNLYEWTKYYHRWHFRYLTNDKVDKRHLALRSGKWWCESVRMSNYIVDNTVECAVLDLEKIIRYID